MALALATVQPAAPALAQESVFNLPGFGLPAPGESVRSSALGGAGTVLSGEVFSLDSPAPLGRFERAGFYLSLLGQQTEVEDRSASGTFEDVVFPMAQVVVPAGDLTLAVGYYQFVDFDAALESSVVFEAETLPATLDSEGGISVLSPALAYALDGRTSAGVSFDIYLGSREEIRAIETLDALGRSLSTADTLVRDFAGAGLTLGIERGLGEGLRVGASYRLRPTITSEVTDASGEGLIGRESQLDLPDELMVAAAARLSSQVEVGALVRTSGWGGFESDARTAGDFTNAVEIGGGVEYAPQSRTALLLGPQAPLRAGFRWRRLPVEVDGEPVREWTTSLGHGRSFGGRSRIDLVLEYGERGSVEANGLSERFLRFGVGVAAFEQWRRQGGGGGAN